MKTGLDRVILYLGVLCGFESAAYAEGVREAELDLERGQFCYKVHGLKYVCYAERLEKALWDGYGVDLIFEDDIADENAMRRVNGYNKTMDQAMRIAFGQDVFAIACEQAEASFELAASA